jgi:hypothetical protein
MDNEKKTAFDAEQSIIAAERDRVHTLSILCLLPVAIMSVTLLLSCVDPKLGRSFFTSMLSTWCVESILVPLYFDKTALEDKSIRKTRANEKVHETFVDCSTGRICRFLLQTLFSTCWRLLLTCHYYFKMLYRVYSSSKWA